MPHEYTPQAREGLRKIGIQERERCGFQKTKGKNPYSLQKKNIERFLQTVDFTFKESSVVLYPPKQRSMYLGKTVVCTLLVDCRLSDSTWSSDGGIKLLVLNLSNPSACCSQKNVVAGKLLDTLQ